MTRWIWKRFALALVAATGMTAATAAQGTNKPAAGDTDVIILKFDGQPDRKVKVVKTSRQPDGKTATEVKDMATGETFTLLDTGTSAPANKGTPPAAPPASKDTALPKAKPRTSDILTPDAPRPPLTTSGKSAPPALPVADPLPEPTKRPGLLGRMFGKKPTPAPAMPAAGANVPPSASVPPAPVPVSTRAPSIPVAGIPGAGTPAEPPRAVPPKTFNAPPTVTPPATVTPPKSVTPPTPAIPAPLPVPTIPPLPGGSQSNAGALQVVLPVGYVPADLALVQDVKPHVHTLQNALAPSARVTAVKTLAGGRHGSSNEVKGIIFHTAKTDPCGLVKACCIEELCKLGYFTPEFVALVKEACNDANDDVKAAATAAATKWTPKR